MFIYICSISLSLYIYIYIYPFGDHPLSLHACVRRLESAFGLSSMWCRYCRRSEPPLRACLAHACLIYYKYVYIYIYIYAYTHNSNKNNNNNKTYGYIYIYIHNIIYFYIRINIYIYIYTYIHILAHACSHCLASQISLRFTRRAASGKIRQIPLLTLWISEGLTRA